MSCIKIDPYSYKARYGKKEGVTLGLLDDPVFAKEPFDEVLAELNERSYENEVHEFVKRLMDGIGSAEKSTSDRNGERVKRECYFLEDEKDFACNYLLFDCIEMLIKAEITINVIKEQRRNLLKQTLKNER